MAKSQAAYPGGVRRTSQLAIRISATLATAGADVSPRRLEGWALEGLGADEQRPFGEQIAHCQALAELAGPGRGRDADAAALRLAAHGYACRRLRGALLRGIGIAEVGCPELRLDFETEESADAAFEHLEEIACGIATAIEDVPLPIRRIIDKLRRNAHEGAWRIGESGEDAFKSAIVNLLCLLLGGEVYDARPIAVVFGMDPAEIAPDAVDFVNQRLRVTAWELDEAYRTEPLAVVVSMAQWLREHAHLAVSFLGLETAPQSHIDEFAALSAPYAVHILRVIASGLDDADEILAILELPAVLQLTDSPSTRLSA